MLFSDFIIQIEDLTKIYSVGEIEVKALRGVSLRVEKGEFISIMGASGSGKSTLMNVLGCLDSPTSGVYLLDGKDVSKLAGGSLAKARNKQIGFVFQSFNLLPKLSAAANVELPMIYAGVGAKTRKRRTYAALAKVGLENRMNHKPNELSGGQKQRVAIARALVNDPSIILADEPTGNLDSKSGNEIMEIFRELNAEGATIVMVTHESSIARQTERILSFKDGRIENDSARPLQQIFGIRGVRP
jgi:putative ABC transport system ATP-binding protein